MAARRKASRNADTSAAAKLAAALKEQKELVEQQAATAEILRIIARGTDSATPVFDAITRAGMRLLPGTRVALFIVRDGHQHYVSHSGLSDEGRAKIAALFPRPVDPKHVAGATILAKKVIHFPDIRVAAAKRYPLSVQIARKVKYRALLSVPLLRGKECIGAITMGRVLPGPFTKRQIALVKTFADQAVIAIQNARLFNETQNALARQTATAEILRVLGSSVTDVQPVFDAIVKNCSELFGEGAIVLRLVSDGQLVIKAAVGYASGPMPIDRTSVMGTCVLDARTLHFPDLDEAAKQYPRIRQLGLKYGYRSGVYAPLVRAGKAIGGISVLRRRPGAFDDKEVQLLTTFADQAVIAIENVRLFNETKEALEQQTATSEVLGVISRSPTDLQPVFDAILKSATQLCEAHLGVLNLYDGEMARTVAVRGGSSAFGKWAFDRGAFEPDGEVLLRVIAERRPVQAADMRQSAGYLQRRPNASRFSDLSGARTFLAVPLVKDDRVVGNIGIYRPEVRPFTERQVALVSMFANQAVIAIENARLFNETKEALEQQTATAEILRVISSSPSDMQPVFDSILEHAMRLCDAGLGTVGLYDGKAYTHRAQRGGSPEYVKRLFDEPFVPGAEGTIGRMVAGRRPVHIPDYRELPAYRAREPRAVATVELGGARTYLAVPMLKDGQVLGGITIRRAEVRPFTQKQIELVSTFANQAVIAIENVRLFNETKESLERQTATAEILKVISASPSDVQPVFETIARFASRLCGGAYAIVTRFDGELMHLVAEDNARPGTSAPTALVYPRRPGRDTPSPRAIHERAMVHIPYAEQDADLAPGFARAVNAGSFLAVPMLRGDVPIGTIGVSRSESGPFPDKQIELVKMFADQAVIAIENVRLFNETKEALEQQTASSEVLGAISSSPTDLKPVFDSILFSATRLCEAHLGILNLSDGEYHRTVAQRGGTPAFAKWVFDRGPYKPDPLTTLSQAIATRRPIQVADVRDTPGYKEGVEVARKFADIGGARTYLAVPLLKEDKVLGILSIYRPEVRPFTEKQVELVKSFASQAVIAMENVRLFNETKESLEQQTAMSEILGVISSSPTDVRPVFDAVLKSATTLCEAHLGLLSLYDGEKFRPVASRGATPEFAKYMAERGAYRSDGNLARLAVERRPVHVADVREAPPYRERRPNSVKFVEMTGARTYLGVPLLKEGTLIGAIIIYRPEVRPFTEKQIALVSTFANQAVIAIENVRLFNETKESLEQQTATSEILKVISSSTTDTQPVFDAIVQSGLKLFPDATVAVTLPDGGQINLAAVASAQPDLNERWRRLYPSALTREYMHGIALLDRRMVDVPDVENNRDPAIAPGVARFLASGFKATTIMPMLRGDAAIGTVSVVRMEPGPLSDKQIALLRTFADQAVIAIENVRLFNETKESLEQQTAISEILRVISSSPADVKPVLDAVAMRAARICEASDARIFLVDGEQLRHSAGFGDLPMPDIGTMRPIDRGLVLGRSVIDGRAVHVEDIQAALDEFPTAANFGARSGQRTILAIPLMREGKALGAILMRRLEVRPFTEKQIALLKTFADQAAIAIENVRLFNATQEALEQQTATTEVLNVISSSITDARPVFDAIARSVLKLYGARNVSLVVRAGESIDRVGYAMSDASADDGTQALWPIPLDDGSLSGRAILGGDIVHIRDVETEEGLSEHSRAITRRTGVRSVLAAPMHSMGTTTGALTISRRSPGGFSEREVEMIRTFADQAVIAMENVRLFKEIEEKSAQLKVASEHKSQFLASMSHELRTPLNALLGFNEMILGDIYGEVPGDMRAPLVQMQTSGKHLLRLINNVLDLAKIEAGRMELALADYSVQDTVESVRSTLRPLAAEKGLELLAAVPADIPLAHGDPGRIAQCLMNLAGNSLKFTKSGKVEISVAADNGLLRYRVADTGIGIPPEKIASLFTEFKQTDATVASEYGGTGLGLAISKKFVEMHGGRIWVESEPGRGSVFTFEIPLRLRGAGAAS